MRYLLVVFLLITNFSFYSASTIEQSILGEFNLIFNSKDEVLRELCIKTIKSHTTNYFLNMVLLMQYYFLYILLIRMMNLNL